MYQRTDGAYGQKTDSRHIFVGETRIATKRTIEGNANLGYEQANTFYYHADHLGSAQLVSTRGGYEYERIEYTPYGELWIEQRDKRMEQDGKTPFRFTGKELDEEAGFYYYGARYLNPKTGVWISADPAVGDYIPSAPVDDEARKRNENLPGMGGVFNYVNFHVYHYAGNNPVKYIDPDGEAPQTFLIGFVGNVDISNPDSGKTMPTTDFMQGHSHILLRAGNEFGVDFVLHPGASMKISTQDGTGDVIIRNLSTDNKAIIADKLLNKISDYKNDLKESLNKNLQNWDSTRRKGVLSIVSFMTGLSTITISYYVPGSSNPLQTIAESYEKMSRDAETVLEAVGNVMHYAQEYDSIKLQLRETITIDLN